MIIRQIKLIKLLKDIKKYQNIHLIVRSKKLGIGSAHLDGILWAYKNNYETVVTMDSDLTHSPKIIESL